MKQVVVKALSAQLSRLLKDKDSPEFKDAPVQLVIWMNDEIAKLRTLLSNSHRWDITTQFEENKS